MRTLVEQTYAEVGWLQEAKLSGKVELHLLMGGAISDRWDAYRGQYSNWHPRPVEPSLESGLQHESRYRWPIHFALLNNDCLWVMDEVQLMGQV